MTEPNTPQPTFRERLGLRGWRAGRRDARTEMVIAAPPQAVWSLVSDVERIAEWWPRAISGIVTYGEEIGREQVVVLDWGRHRGTLHQRVTSWEPNRRYAWRITGEQYGDREMPRALDTQIAVDIAPDGPLSRVSIFAAYEPVGPRGALALRQVSRLAQKTFKEALRRAEHVLLPG